MNPEPARASPWRCNECLGRVREFGAPHCDRCLSAMAEVQDGAKPEAKDRWLTALDQLTHVLDEAALEFYLKPLHPVGISQGTLWLTGWHQARAMAERRYTAAIHNATGLRPRFIHPQGAVELLRRRRKA